MKADCFVWCWPQSWSLQVGRYLQKFLGSNQGFKVSVSVCECVRACVLACTRRLESEDPPRASRCWKLYAPELLVSENSPQKWNIVLRCRLSPLASVCSTPVSNAPAQMIITQWDLFFFSSKLGWASDQHPGGRRQRSNSSPRILLFSFLSYKANIKNVIWILGKIKAEGHQKEEGRAQQRETTHLLAHSLFYRHWLSLFSRLLDGCAARQSPGGAVPRVTRLQTKLPQRLIEVPWVTQVPSL